MDMSKRKIDKTKFVKRTKQYIVPAMMEVAVVYMNKFGKVFLRCSICHEMLKMVQKTDVFKTHIQSHFSMLPFSCHFCSQKFANFDLLIKHDNADNCAFPKASKIVSVIEVPDSDLDEKEVEPKLVPKPISKTGDIISQHQKLCLPFQKVEKSKGGMDTNHSEPEWISEPIPEEDDILYDAENVEILGEEIPANTDQTEIDAELFSDSIPEELDNFSNAENVEKSEKEKAAKGKHHCEICNKSFTRKSSLQTHNDTFHIIPGSKPRLKKSLRGHFPCDLCCQIFTRKCSLQKHDKRFHQTLEAEPRKHLNTTVLSDFRCEICKKYYASKNNLKIHARVHTQERPYKCKVCHKGFASKSYLQNHNMLHTGEKPFQCNICGVTMRFKSIYDVHMNRHSNILNYKCKHCGKRFLTCNRLTAHLRTHSDERPYKCDMCDRAFRRRDALRQHTFLHTGKKMHKCKICDAAFAQFSGLYSHMRTHQVVSV